MRKSYGEELVLFFVKIKNKAMKKMNSTSTLYLHGGYTRHWLYAVQVIILFDWEKGYYNNNHTNTNNKLVPINIRTRYNLLWLFFSFFFFYYYFFRSFLFVQLSTWLFFLPARDFANTYFTTKKGRPTYSYEWHYWMKKK